MRKVAHYRHRHHAILCMVFNILAVLVTPWDRTSPASNVDKRMVLKHGQVDSSYVMGPLTKLSTNSRYFTANSARATYLTGSHHWDNLVDFSSRQKFDYGAYLKFLRSHNHNFVRLWTRENAFDTWGENNPFPYQRTGPGTALDGKPKFDLTRFDSTYFDRLRSRVVEARAHKIYVMVMLFNGFSVHQKHSKRSNPWPGHAFNAQNNVNGIDGDLNGNGQGEEVHTLNLPAITRLQEAYVRKVVDILNDMDNVLFEISNESQRASGEWQSYMTRFIHNYERSKPKQHPVVMTFMWDGDGDHGNDDNAALVAAPAEAISPGRGLREEYKKEPPAADGTKVIISDTDHLWGIGGNEEWVWKSFLRGLNPIFMDPIGEPKWDSVRRAMGQTLTVANRVDLARMIPREDLASSTYCLSNPGVEYLVYLPADSHWFERRLKAWMDSIRFVRRFSHVAETFRSLLKLSVTVNLPAASDHFAITWFNTSTGEFIRAGKISGGGKKSFIAPFAGPAILHLARRF